MSGIFKSNFLNEYFAQGLEKEDFTLEDLKEIECMTIVNEDPNQFIKIESEDLKILCSLGCQSFFFEGIDLDGVKFDEITLTQLEFSRCKLSTCDFSNLQVKKCLAFYDGVELKNNGISQFAHMTEIEQFQCIDCGKLDLTSLSNLKKVKYLKIEGNVSNISGISDLKELTNVEVKRVSNVPSYLPVTENLETLEINDPEILDIHFLQKYPKLKQIRLPESQIDISQLDVLCELKRRGISIKFDETTIKEQLKQREYKIEGKYLKTIKEMFSIPENVPLNDYELLRYYRYRKTRLLLEDIKVLDELIKSGLIDENSIINKFGDIEGVDFEIESLEDATPDIIKYISQNKDKQFRFIIRTLNGLDNKVLDKLSENSENIEFYVQGDFSHFQNQKDASAYQSKAINFNSLNKLVPYKLGEMRDFVSILEPIREQAFQAKSDIEKFAIIRKIALMRSSYDYSGVISSEQFKAGREIDTRSLKGILLEGKAVCSGNALGFSIIAEYVGIRAKYINGHPVSNNNIRTWMESNKNIR